MFRLLSAVCLPKRHALTTQKAGEYVIKLLGVGVVDFFYTWMLRSPATI